MNADETDKRAEKVVAVRRLVETLGRGGDALEAALAAGDFDMRADELLRGVADSVRGLTAEEAAPSSQRVGFLLEPMFARFKARASGEEKPVPVPWPDLAALWGGGLWPGAHVLVGSTGTGKTALQLQLALHAASEGVPVLYIGLELGELDLVARLVALLDEARPLKSAGIEGVHASEILQGKVPAARLEALETAAFSRLSELPFELEMGDAHGWDYMQLTPRVQALRERYKLAAGAPVLVVLDYLQLVSSPEGKREDIRERIGKAAYQARQVARNCSAAVLVTSSTARSNDTLLKTWGKAWPNATGEVRKGEDVGLWDLVGLGKEAGEVEYSADSLTVMANAHRCDGTGAPGDGPATRVRIGCPKNRNGRPNQETTLLFLGSRWVPDGKRDAVAAKYKDAEAVDAALRKADADAKRDFAKTMKGKGSKGTDRAAGDEGTPGL